MRAVRAAVVSIASSVPCGRCVDFGTVEGAVYPEDKLLSHQVWAVTGGDP